MSKEKLAITSPFRSSISSSSPSFSSPKTHSPFLFDDEWQLIDSKAEVKTEVKAEVTITKHKPKKSINHLPQFPACISYTEYVEKHGVPFAEPPLLAVSDKPLASAEEKPSEEKSPVSRKGERKKLTPTIIYPLQTINFKTLLGATSQAILAFGRKIGIKVETMDATAVLEQLQLITSIDSSFTARLKAVWLLLNSWHKARLLAPTPWPPGLNKDAVFIWPCGNANQQNKLQELRSAFWLNEKDSQQLIDALLVIEALKRCVAAFDNYELNTVQYPADSKSEVAVDDEEQPLLESKQSSPQIDEGSIELQQLNPLDAAIQHTLKELNHPEQPGGARDAKSSVIWLAQMMVRYSKELPVPDVSDLDPERTKENPLLRQHWKQYWQIPKYWRKLYIEVLQQSGQQEKTNEVTDFLMHAPDKAGWRLSTDLELATWQKSLRELCEQAPCSELPPKAKARIAAGKEVWLQWVENNQILWAPLKSKYISVIFDSKHQLKVKGNKIGNHRVYALENDKFFLKFFPEQPVTELIVTTIDRQLGINGTPQQQLFAVHHAPLKMNDGTTYGVHVTQSAALLSQAVQGFNLSHDVLKRDPQKLEDLDFKSFVAAFLRVLLTNPEDDKSNDYFCVPIPGTSRFRLVRIDNERAFLEPFKLQKGVVLDNKELLVKSIIYCMDQMYVSWNKDAQLLEFLDNFRQIRPIDLVESLIGTLEQLQPQWMSTFSKEVIAQHARCQEPFISLPLVFVPPKCETILFQRLSLLQSYLHRLQPEEITAMRLLELIQPKLAALYKPAFDKWSCKPTEAHKHVSDRFQKVAGKYYKSPKKDKGGKENKDSKEEGGYQSTLTGSTVLSITLNEELPDQPKTEEDRQKLEHFALDIRAQRKHAISEAVKRVEQLQAIQHEEIRQGLLAMAEQSQIDFRRLLNIAGQEIVLSLLFPEGIKASDLSTKQQEFLLSTLTGVVLPWLNLKPFQDILVNKRLKLFFKDSGNDVCKGFAVIDISGCNKLTSDALEIVADNCPSLQQLYINNINWTEVFIPGLPALTAVELNNAQALTKFEIAYLPCLQRLSLQNNISLTMLKAPMSRRAAAMGGLLGANFGIVGLGIAAAPFTFGISIAVSTVVGAVLGKEAAKRKTGFDLRTGVWIIPSLNQLNTVGCRSLTEVAFRVNRPEHLQWFANGCEQLQIVGPFAGWLIFQAWRQALDPKYRELEMNISNFVTWIRSAERTKQASLLRSFAKWLAYQYGPATWRDEREAAPHYQALIEKADAPISRVLPLLEAGLKGKGSRWDFTAYYLTLEETLAITMVLCLRTKVSGLQFGQSFDPVELWALAKALHDNKTLTAIDIDLENTGEVYQEIKRHLQRNRNLVVQSLQAIATNDLSKWYKLKEHGASIDQMAGSWGEAYRGYTPLMVAVQSGRPEIIALLLLETSDEVLLAQAGQRNEAICAFEAVDDIAFRRQTALQMAIALHKDKPEQAATYQLVIEQIIQAHQSRNLPLPDEAKPWFNGSKDEVADSKMSDKPQTLLPTATPIVLFQEEALCQHIEADYRLREYCNEVTARLTEILTASATLRSGKVAHGGDGLDAGISAMSAGCKGILKVLKLLGKATKIIPVVGGAVELVADGAKFISEKHKHRADARIARWTTNPLEISYLGIAIARRMTLLRERDLFAGAKGAKSLEGQIRHSESIDWREFCEDTTLSEGQVLALWDTANIIKVMDEGSPGSTSIQLNVRIAAHTEQLLKVFCQENQLVYNGFGGYKMADSKSSSSSLIAPQGPMTMFGKATQVTGSVIKEQQQSGGEQRAIGQVVEDPGSRMLAGTQGGKLSGKAESTSAPALN
jgi:hypothetical protein